MNRMMMRRTERDEIVDIVRAVFGTQPEVMDVDERRMPTAGNPAAAPVATQHLSARGWRNRLLRARGSVQRAHVGAGCDFVPMRKVLLIALRHFDGFS